MKLRAALATLLFLLVSSLATQAGDHWDQLPVAPQSGPSCGFFANVPALTLATGININSSRPFVSSIYGLRRGDFRFERSFDKRMFFELFSIPYESVKIEHPPGRPESLLPVVRKLITETFHQGLSDGFIYSLRIRGVFDGPHNGLLLAREGDRYLLHDPYPGVIRRLTIDELAKRMLVRSTLKKNQGKPVYVTHFLIINLEDRSEDPFKAITELSPSLKAILSEEQRKQLKGQLKPRRLSQADWSLADYVHAFPAINFAALPGKGSDVIPRNVIGQDLKADQLDGLLNLSKFTLSVWHQKRRPLLPVVFFDNQPWILTSFLKPDPQKPKLPNLVFDNGESRRWLTSKETLRLIKRQGAMYGTVSLAQSNADASSELPEVPR